MKIDSHQCMNQLPAQSKGAKILDVHFGRDSISRFARFWTFVIK